MMRELLFSVTLKDCDVQAKRGSGKGGQNRNKRDTAIRIVHNLSGAVGECEEQRSQLQNKRIAFVRMTQTPEFRKWLALEQWIRSGFPSPEEAVEKEMSAENIRVEVKKNNKWIIE